MGFFWYWTVVYPILGWSTLWNGSYISGPPTLRKRSALISPQRIMLHFGAIISVFRNRGNTPKGSTPPYVARSRRRLRRTGVQISKELHLDWGQQDEGVTNCSRHCLLSNWEPRSDAFSAGATTKPPPGLFRAGADGFSPKNEPWSVSPHFVHRWSASEYYWCAHYATPLQHPQHEQAQIDPIDLHST